MPRYFVNGQDGYSPLDGVGTVLPDICTAPRCGYPPERIWAPTA